MPQTIAVRTAKVITLPAPDLATVNLATSGESMLVINNNGPGKVYLSFDPGVTATVAGVDTFGMFSGQSVTVPRIRRGSTSNFTAIADTASTILTLLCLPAT